MRFGAYELLEPLGRGGMAETFRARRVGGPLVRDVCLKRVLPDRAAESGFVRLFRREAEVASQLVHPHIAQVYEFGCEEGRWWMTLEYVPGGDLRRLLSRLAQPLPVELTLVLAIDVLSALECAHERSLVHRDVSPSNILLDLQGNFKLADFGIAKPTHKDLIEGAKGFTTTTGTVRGKPAYMAPEQALGKPVDARSDLWSMGVVLFECLAGQRPFDGPTDLATMMAANLGQRPRLLELAPHVPGELAAIVEALLRPDLGKRPRSAAEVIDALGQLPSPVHGRRRLAEMIRSVQQEAPDSASPIRTEGVGDTLAIDPALTRTLASESGTDRSGMESALSSRAQPTPVVTPPPAPAPSTQPPRRSRRWLAGLGGGLVLAAALAVTRGPTPRDDDSAASSPPTVTPHTPSAPVERAASTPAPVPLGVAPPPESPEGSTPEPSSRPRRSRPQDEPPAATPRAEGPAAETTNPERPSSPAPVEPRPTVTEEGTLRVLAIPWGDVTIDGERVGRAPLVRRLPVGRHRVTVSSEGGTRERPVVIESERTHELEFDFEASP